MEQARGAVALPTEQPMEMPPTMPPGYSPQHMAPRPMSLVPMAPPPMGYPAMAPQHYPSPVPNYMYPEHQRPSRGNSSRWALETDDVLLLERVFELERCPGRDLRQQLAAHLNVSARQVQVWFQNKRQRTKNGAKPTIAEARAHAAEAEAELQTQSAKALMSMVQPRGPGEPDGPPPALTMAAAAANGEAPVANGTPVEGATMAEAAEPDAPTNGEAEPKPAEAKEGEAHAENGEGHEAKEAGAPAAAEGEAAAPAPAVGQKRPAPTAASILATARAASLLPRAGGVPPMGHVPMMGAVPYPPHQYPPPMMGMAPGMPGVPQARSPYMQWQAPPTHPAMAPVGVPGMPQPAMGMPVAPPGMTPIQPMVFPGPTSAPPPAARPGQTTLQPTTNQAASDGYFDGRTLWMRQDLLHTHPDVLSPDAMPVFVANQPCMVQAQTAPPAAATPTPSGPTPQPAATPPADDAPPAPILPVQPPPLAEDIE